MVVRSLHAKKKLEFLIALLTICCPTSLGLGLNMHALIIWNVGQGQWVTVRNATHCIHIDMGGEYADWKKIQQTCSASANILLLTHGDWDHINFMLQAQQLLPHFCLFNQPRETLSRHKKKFLKRVKKCKDFSLPQEVKELSTNHYRIKNANDASRVYLIQNKILVPGDSSQKMENIWGSVLPSHTVKYLILGHHGSRTSSSTAFLRKLRPTAMAVASARKRKYGHPHPLVLERLRKNKIHGLTTEEWGHIFIKL